ncbi:NAD(P)/FAD-dependent oxidoreductase [Halovenus salina]|uniref:NAD(P)/FAD-dependent oxidoreductase n=1 Tax=Halovenus salina TaxID=1510225 RepID=UPI00226103E6|nr:NAD(P)/FAD-dependent oxidoreductase [Halovenus salina]
MERIDVAVVGGGPAGTSAAWQAAKHGAEAVVFEKGVPRADRDGMGPDSTDAAGLLDYWVDLMGFDPDEIPEDIILRRLDGADFIGPSATLSLDNTGISASYPHFGCAFHRARFDDWLRERAEDAGGRYAVGDSVTSVETHENGGYSHTLTLSGGEQVEAEYLILADGPQRTVTVDTLDQFTADGHSIADVLDPSSVNHIAYQEHREVPEELYDPHRLKFWWGLMPGHTAYPWVFPNDGNVARIGLTMPIGLDIEDYDHRKWALLRSDDEKIPQGKTYIERLIHREYPEYDIEDFPLVEERGKRKGTETYAISSTRPIESPTRANIAVVGGAMGGTSAFHEGGDHVAVRTGKIAGRLAAQGQLDRYNSEWKGALDTEFLRNVTMADLVREYEPADWDRAFETAGTMTNQGERSLLGLLKSGLSGVKLLREYQRRKRSFSDGNYVQFSESEYSF